MLPAPREMTIAARTRTRTLPLGLLSVALMVALISAAVYFNRHSSRPSPPGSVVSVNDGAELSLSESFPPDSTVFFFLRTDCPIGNRYAPKIAQIAAEFGALGYTFHLIYPDDTPEKIKQHQQEFALNIAAYHDPDHAIVRLLGITRAPEAVVIDASGRQVYRGRIDDQFVDFGKSRPQPTTDDLRDVLAALARGEPVVPTVTQAVGCYIE